jgi:oxygen-independent coproporphyrinogen-3 oxidase
MPIPRDVFERYAGMHVPRYTSYPTAPHFTPTVGPAEYRRWLGQQPENDAFSIYLHIPFCREMCWYCGCHTTVANRRAPVARYVAALAQEIRLVAAELGGRRRIAHWHWGGGSPTLLKPGDIVQLAGELHATFDVDPASEIAVEVDPRTLEAPVAEAFARAGTNRASIGVQSFDPQVQAAINRVQSFEVTAGAADLLRKHGIEAINLDLVYGLPFQTVASCVQTVEQALRLEPQRLAIFGYAHVPDFKPHQRKIDEAALPGSMERQAQFAAIAEALIGAGYLRIGLDHFALRSDPLAIAAAEGRLHRNFQGYTADPSGALIGFGASAIGHLANGYVQNAVRIPDYERRVADGKLAVVRGYALSDEDRRRAVIIEQLMCRYQADVGAIAAPLEQLERDGLIRRSGSLVEVVDEARTLVRVVAAAFDANLPNSAATHVTAV